MHETELQPLQQRHISFSGVLGSGKTTQARLLGKRLGITPFLGKEHEQPEIISGEIFTQGSDLEAEKWFVDHHAKALASLRPHDSRGSLTDCSLESDLAIGRTLLTGKDLIEFEEYWTQASRQLAPTDISILLLVNEEVLINRIQKRARLEGRDFERTTSIDFVAMLQDGFTEHNEVLGERVVVIDHRNQEDSFARDISRSIAKLLDF